ncbi:hypothetical protein Tco_0819125 [Tanacetum coccineum]|uniref:Uncharacterized protein n=1 Tax=Tanacetum coccineum TaxID=301880 RepID=A0ABQ5A6J5_9ASTR
MGCLPRSACLGSRCLTHHKDLLILGESLEIWNYQVWYVPSKVMLDAMTIHFEIWPVGLRKASTVPYGNTSSVVKRHSYGILVCREIFNLELKRRNSSTNVENTVFDVEVHGALFVLAFIDQEFHRHDHGTLHNESTKRGSLTFSYGFSNLTDDSACEVLGSLVSNNFEVKFLEEENHGAILPWNPFLPKRYLRADWSSCTLLLFMVEWLGRKSLLETCPKTATYGEIACIAHKLKWKVPVWSNQDWSFRKSIFQCLESSNAVIGKDEWSILLKEMVIGRDFFEEFPNEPTGKKPAMAEKTLIPCTVVD